MNTGIYTEDNYNNNHFHSDILANALVLLLKTTNKIYDFGCGTGFYTDFLNREGFYCTGIDGFVKDKKYIEFDLTTPLFLDKKGDIICLEVAEHIPKEFEFQFLKNLYNNCNGTLIISWAIPHQGGVGHVNELDNLTVIKKFKGLDFEFNLEDTIYLRDIMREDPLWWFKSTLMVFNKK